MIDAFTRSKISFLALAIISLGIFGFALEEAFAAVPQFDTYVADDPDNADNVLSNGDTLTITFDIATNATGNGIISQAEIDANFTDGGDTAPDFGTTYSGVWSADSTSLTITLTDVTGANLNIGASTIGGRSTTTIADADGGNADLINNGGDTATLSGDFGVLPTGSDCSRDCTPPTMGPDSNGNLIVEDGFSYNGHAVNVAAWHTEYPLITVQTGKMNVLQAKIYDDWGSDDIRSFTVAFGVPQIGNLYQGETIIKYYPNEIIGSQLHVYDKNHLLDKVSITTEKTDCNSGENSPVCTLLTVNHMFREAPLANVVGISLSDGTRNAAQFYFNDGIEVDGQSLNPPQTAMTTLNKKGAPQIQLTQIDRGDDLWVDEQNNLWSKHSYGTWFKVTPDDGPIKQVEPISTHGIDRNHALFNTYKLGQELIATKVWDSNRIVSNLAESNTITFDGISRMNDPQLQQAILDEIHKAEQIYAQKYNN